MVGYAFKLELLKKMLSYWSRDKGELIALIVGATYPPLIGWNIVMFLSTNTSFRWLNLAVAIFLTAVGYAFHRKYLITIFRIISGRCVRDIAAIKFDIAVNKPESVRCPICGSHDLVLYHSINLGGNTFKIVETWGGKNQCYFCGFSLEKEEL